MTIKEPCEKAKVAYAKSIDEHKTNRERFSMILSSICPDCGKKLIKRNLHRRFWQVDGNDWEKVCETHGILDAGRYFNPY